MATKDVRERNDDKKKGIGNIARQMKEQHAKPLLFDKKKEKPGKKVIALRGSGGCVGTPIARLLGYVKQRET